jgi:transcriptional antiterminator NusG
MRKEWYVLQVYSGMENKVKETLEERIKNLGYEKYFGKIIIPEVDELNYSNKRVQKIYIEKEAQIFVKKGNDVKKGDILAREPEIFAKTAGKIVDIKNFRKILVETEGKKYSKTFLIPESAGLLAGLKAGKKVRADTPFSKNLEYKSDVDGEIVSVEKVKRVVIENESKEKDIYLLPRETFIHERFKVGSNVRIGDKLCEPKEYKAKFSGRIDIRETPFHKEIKIIKTKKKNLFPGYVFVEMMYTKETEELVGNLPYVSTILNIGGKPVKLNKNEIRVVLRLMGEEAYQKRQVKEIRTDFELGEHVKIINGPFEYFTGKIKDYDLEKQEVQVVVTMFGRETTVTLSLGEIEKIID